MKKDKYLNTKKAELKKIIETFEKAEKYTGHIIIDVDPA
jgi:hypothetical protein